MTREQLFTHLAVKNEFNMVVGGLVKSGRLGLYFPDGALLSNVDADIACIPDATFVATASLADRDRLIEGKAEGYVELEGSPDMVLEVVSRSSVNKDTVLLRQAYWQAGVREYWLVDARAEPLKFDILRHNAKAYRATPRKDGWFHFGRGRQKSFRLTQQAGPLGHPEYTLEMR